MCVFFTGKPATRKMVFAKATPIERVVRRYNQGNIAFIGYRFYGCMSNKSINPRVFMKTKKLLGLLALAVIVACTSGT